MLVVLHSAVSATVKDIKYSTYSIYKYCLLLYTVLISIQDL